MPNHPISLTPGQSYAYTPEGYTSPTANISCAPDSVALNLSIHGATNLGPSTDLVPSNFDSTVFYAGKSCGVRVQSNLTRAQGDTSTAVEPTLTYKFTSPPPAAAEAAVAEATATPAVLTPPTLPLLELTISVPHAAIASLSPEQLSANLSIHFFNPSATGLPSGIDPSAQPDIESIKLLVNTMMPHAAPCIAFDMNAAYHREGRTETWGDLAEQYQGNRDDILQWLHDLSASSTPGPNEDVVDGLPRAK